jgi:phosphoenolpyruvate carboxykinase (ATP)
MTDQGLTKLIDWLRSTGIGRVGALHYNLATPQLVEKALDRGEGKLSCGGAFVTRTGRYTGRAAKDKFTVKSPETENTVDWKANTSFTEQNWKLLYGRVTAHLQGKEMFVQDVYCGADKKERMACRIVTRQARHSHFVRNMFLVPTLKEREAFEPEFTVLHCPNFQADPSMDDTHSEAFVALNFQERKVIIGGTQYAGEIKKSVFTAMNYFANARGVLTMHCSSNVGRDGDVALFFGLSGTGKTTLSADPNRALVGDDEHGWGNNGVFNLEGGCYAKVIRLSPEAEPEIYATTHMFGTILENVILDDDTRRLDLDNASLTENTRASYPLSSIPNHVKSGVAGHPKNIVFLTCDAFGVLPPLSRLSSAQAMYHFLSGYTAKVAGTEHGVTEPVATFSACFGAPFMPRPPNDYAKLLGQKMGEQGASAWLVNTGWSGGPVGEGARMSIKYTRALLNAAISGQLRESEFETHPVFGLDIPKTVQGVPDEILQPRKTWKNPAAYDAKAEHLANLFHENFAQFEDLVSDEVRQAGPLPRVSAETKRVSEQPDVDRAAFRP